MPRRWRLKPCIQRSRCRPREYGSATAQYNLLKAQPQKKMGSYRGPTGLLRLDRHPDNACQRHAFDPAGLENNYDLTVINYYPPHRTH